MLWSSMHTRRYSCRREVYIIFSSARNAFARRHEPFEHGGQYVYIHVWSVRALTSSLLYSTRVTHDTRKNVYQDTRNNQHPHLGAPRIGASKHWDHLTPIRSMTRKTWIYSRSPRHHDSLVPTIRFSFFAGAQCSEVLARGGTILIKKLKHNPPWSKGRIQCDIHIHQGASSADKLFLR